MEFRICGFRLDGIGAPSRSVVRSCLQTKVLGLGAV